MDEMAIRFREKGIDMFVFGSLAQTYPNSYRGADLDLGFEASDGVPISMDRVREIQQCVEELPTVRPVDLVDFNRVEEGFRTSASKYTVQLPSHYVYGSFE